MDRSGQIEVQPFGELVDRLSGTPPSRRRDPRQLLASGEPLEKAVLAGDVTDTAVNLDTVPGAVRPEDPRRPTVGEGSP